MALSTQFDPIEITRFLPEVAGDTNQRSAALAAFAREQLAEAQTVNRRALGRVPPHDVVVDGRADAPLESVKPDGRISFEFELLDDMFAWISHELVKASPVGQADDPRPGHPGAYRASHVFLVDGVAVEPGATLPPIRDEAIFLSTVAYARKIERGLSRQAPDGVYEGIALKASQRFGNIARIGFDYRAPLFGEVDVWADRTASGGHRKSDRAQWLRNQPAIIITFRG